MDKRKEFERLRKFFDEIGIKNGRVTFDLDQADKDFITEALERSVSFYSKNMNLILTRQEFNEKATIGTLERDGEFECFTLEDKVRTGPKIPGETAIPFGKYEVIVTFSQRFQKPLPLLVNVPGFDGIRIHPGNTDKDTHGCILVGSTKGGADFIGNSKIAFERLFPKIQEALKAGKCFIEIKDGRTTPKQNSVNV